jgi:hypothetical protein
MRATRAIIHVAHYVALSYDKVSTIDNRSWLSIHFYVMQNWVNIPILISLDRVVVGSRSDNLIKVIMVALMISGGLPRNQTIQKLICFGADGVNVFQGTRTSVTK